MDAHNRDPFIARTPVPFILSPLARQPERTRRPSMQSLNPTSWRHPRRKCMQSRARWHRANWPSRLRVLNMYAKHLLSGQGAQVQAMSDQRLVTLFYRMMPTNFQHTFKRSGKVVGSPSLKQLATYFDTLQSLEPSGPRKKINQQGKIDTKKKTWPLLSLIIVFFFNSRLSIILATVL